jgi:serine/threonine protein kinase
MLTPGAQVSLEAVLGEGTFGQTFRGAWRGGEAAVKCVRIGRASEAASFLREVAVLAALRHPNVMGFYGALAGLPV